MDKLDKKILSELQLDGRLSITELAERVGLSLSACHRRVRALEEIEAITGYRAGLNPKCIGLNFSAIVFVTLKESSKDSIAKFEDAVTDIPEIVQANRLFGDPDYLLHIFCKDLADFQRLYDEKLSAITGILRLTSTIVMKNVIKERAFPIL